MLVLGAGLIEAEFCEGATTLPTLPRMIMEPPSLGLLAPKPALLLALLLRLPIMSRKEPLEASFFIFCS